jgi:hypothetical protein
VLEQGIFLVGIIPVATPKKKSLWIGVGEWSGDCGVGFVSETNDLLAPV